MPRVAFERLLGDVDVFAEGVKNIHRQASQSTPIFQAQAGCGIQGDKTVFLAAREILSGQDPKQKHDVDSPGLASVSIKTTRRIAFAFGCVALVALATASATAEAQVSVGENGVASYGFPIAVPPGIAGMAPSLGLAYTGGGLNGPVGYGWSLQGASRITRCAQTRAIDGFARGVNYSTNDKLCLDGQRLIQTNADGVVVNGLVNGVPIVPSPSNIFQSADSLGGTSTTVEVREYRTEKDSFARIRAYGRAGGDVANGPAFFKVWAKNGQVYEYGNNANTTANSAFTAQGKTVVAVWALSRLSDTLGNFIDYQYEQRDFLWGSGPTAGLPTLGREWNLLEVRYTGRGSQVPANKVVFTYDDRSDTAVTGPSLDLFEAYGLGSKNISNRRLNSIRTYVNAQTAAPILVKTVKLVYDYGAATKRSRLHQIIECAGAAGTLCLPPTTFNYADGGNHVFQPNPKFAQSTLSSLNLAGPNSTRGVLTVDFDGDGRTDLLLWSDVPAENMLYTSKGDGSFQAAPAFNLTGTTNNLFKSDRCFGTMVTDINGDGLPDLVRFSANVTISGTACPTPPPTAIYKNNGDGSFGTFAYTGPVLERLASRSLPCVTKDVIDGICNHSGWTRGATFYFMDVDGDGLPDLITTELVAYAKDLNPAAPGSLCVNCTHFYKGDGQGGFVEKPTNLANISVLLNPSSLGGAPDAPRNLVDVDGDGLTDFIGLPYRPETGTIFATYLSRGDGNFNLSPTAPVCTVPMDFNGDGRMDCLTPDILGAPSNNKLSVNSGGSTALTAVAGFNLTGPTDYLSVYVIDINGDGRHDLLRWSDDQTQNFLYVSNGDGTFTKSTTFNINSTFRPLKTSDGTYDMIPGDFTGRGSIEFLRLKTPIVLDQLAEFDRNQLFERADKTPADQLVSVVSPSGLTTTLTWVPLSNSVSGGVARYSSDRSASPSMLNPKAAQFPTVDVSLPMYVVATSVADTGVGTSTITAEYSYTGLKAGYDGRGLKGFRETRRMGPGPDGTPITVVTQYIQGHPYVGMTSKTETHIGNYIGSVAVPVVPTSSKTLVYCDKTMPGAEGSATSASPCAVTTKMQRPYLYSSVDTGRDLKGVDLPSVTTVNTFDDAGNPTQIAITTSGMALGLAQTFTKTTTNIYQPDQTSGNTWVLGRLVESRQRNTAPYSLGSGGITTSAGNAPLASATQGTVPSGAVTLSTSLAFGNITVRASATGSVTLTNTAPSAVTVTVPTASAISGAGFSVASTTCTASLAAGASCTISLSFTPIDNTLYLGTLSVVTGAGTLSSALSGTGVGGLPALTLSSCSSGGSSASPTPMQQTCVLGNGGTAASSITYSTTVAGGSASGPASCAANTVNCGAVIVTSPATGGTYNGTVTATPNSGTGATSASLQLVVTSTTLTVNPTFFNGVTNINTSPVGSFTVGIAGTATGLSVTSPYGFIQNNTCTGSQTGSCSFQWTTAAGKSSGSGTVTVSATNGANTLSIPVSRTYGGPPDSAIATLTSPASQTFPATWLGSAVQTLAVSYRNDGTLAMTLNSPALAAPLSVTGNTCSGVAPAASCSITIALATNVAGLGQSQSFTPTGADTAPAAEAIGWSVYTAIPRWSTTSVNMGTTGVGVSITQNITLFNDGNVAYNWAANSTVANLPAGYAFNTSACASVAPGGGSCNVIITLTPPAAGTYGGSNIYMSAASTVGNTLTVTGVGGTPGLTLSSCSSGGSSTSPTPMQQTCVLGNGGTAASSITYSTTVAGGSASGPASCAASTVNCGTVTVTSPTAAGTYNGTVSATPSGGAAATSVALQLVVNSGLLTLSVNPTFFDGSTDTNFAVVGTFRVSFSGTATGLIVTKTYGTIINSTCTGSKTSFCDFQWSSPTAKVSGSGTVTVTATNGANTLSIPVSRTYTGAP